MAPGSTAVAASRGSRGIRAAEGCDTVAPPRGCGGIGRRARFRSVWRQLRGGSSPLIRMSCHTGQPMIICDSFVIADWTDPGTHPGRPIAGLHLHRSDDEAWMVLDGRLGFRLEEERREGPAGER